jgi:hypothetical protein
MRRGGWRGSFRDDIRPLYPPLRNFFFKLVTFKIIRLQFFFANVSKDAQQGVKGGMIWYPPIQFSKI